MRVKEWVQNILVPYEEKVERLTREQEKLGRLYELMKTPGFQEVQAYFVEQEQSAQEELRKFADKGVLSVWLFAGRIWRAAQKAQDAKTFLEWMNSVPQRLLQVSEELRYLTKNS